MGPVRQVKRNLGVPSTIDGKPNLEYHRLYDRQWRREHKTQAKAYKGRWRDRVYEYLRGIKMERGCVDCGFKVHHAALDFDHVRGKAFSFAPKGRDMSLEQLDIEIAKCEVRCANCHRIKTWGEKS